MVGPERPAVDKLRAVEVLVPNVKAAEDLNLRPVTTASASLGTRSMLHAPHQPPNLTFKELIVPSVGYRQPEPSKPVGTAKVVQKVGQFGPKVLENRMQAQSLSDDLGVPIFLPRAVKPFILP
jgi:hypothetical protein